MYPVKDVYITSPFGPRTSDKFHYGTDFRSQKGGNALAILPYECVLSKLNYGSPQVPGYGEYVILEHVRKDGSKFCSLYAHLDVRKIAVGDTGKEGDVIAFTGDTPDYRNLAPHLHFEIRDVAYDHPEFWTKTIKNGRSVPMHCVDPVVFMNSSEDDDISEWAIEPRDLMIKLGVTDGTRPKDIATREEIWTMMYNYHMRGL